MSELIIATDSGLYCPAGDFHIDPHRKVPRAVITHAHADHARPGMGHYWATKAGEGLMRARVGRSSPMTLLAYGERITMGSTTLSLHPAGHVLGSAQVRIELDGEVWVVSGDYKRCPDPTCAPFEPQACNVFITEATFAQPIYQWNAPEKVVQQIFAWWQQCKADGKAAVLFCYALGKAQRVLAELARYTDEQVLLHGAMTPLVAIYRKAGVKMLSTAPVGCPPKGTRYEGRLILAPPGANGTPWMRRFATCVSDGAIKKPSKGFASGWMGQNSARREAYDQGFALSDHTDWPGLLRTIEETGAQRILAMHGHTETLLQVLRARGLDAAELKTYERDSTAHEPVIEDVAAG